jgi:hypothetical protein
MITVSNDNDVKIEMNDDNFYQVSFCTTLNSNSNIREIMKQNKLYELLKVLNVDIIELFEMESENGIDNIKYVFNFGNFMSDFFEKSEEVKYCLNVTNSTLQISEDKYEIKGTTNEKNYNGSIKLAKITDIVIVLEIINENVIVFLSYKNNDNDFNKIQKKALVNVISKILGKLKLYLE